MSVSNVLGMMAPGFMDPDKARVLEPVLGKLPPAKSFQPLSDDGTFKLIFEAAYTAKDGSGAELYIAEEVEGQFHPDRIEFTKGISGSHTCLPTKGMSFKATVKYRDDRVFEVVAKKAIFTKTQKCQFTTLPDEIQWERA